MFVVKEFEHFFDAMDASISIEKYAKEGTIEIDKIERSKKINGKKRYYKMVRLSFEINKKDRRSVKHVSKILFG